MTLRSLIIVPLLGAALAFGQDEEGKSSKEPIWRRAMNAAERSIERGDKKGAGTLRGVLCRSCGRGAGPATPATTSA